MKRAVQNFNRSSPWQSSWEKRESSRIKNIHKKEKSNVLQKALSQNDRRNSDSESKQFAEQAVQALIEGKEYIVIGGLKEKVGVWLSRLSPSLMYKMIRRSKVR